MWYNKNRPNDIQAPTRVQLITLRLMILLGLVGMGLFLWGILQVEHISNAILYFILMFSMVFICLTVLFEWYHYFSISVPVPPLLRQKFSVDVFTTFCPGEPYDMIVETLEAIQKISWPHTTYLCDEANDPFLLQTCNRLGVVHVTRNNRVNAKAGNINNALQQAKGDICLVLDPDHVPAPDFFDHVLPYFEDPEVGFVQVVQAYQNINENLIAKGSAQQTFQFYGPMMMTMGSYGTAQAIGANCTFRRAALDSIGGHAPGLAEDMNTSMKLHAQGWKSVYVPKVLTRGLVPNTLSAYYKQQLKWSRGVFELLVTTYVQNFRRFSWRQKVHYGLLPWHYFSGAIFLINFLIPIISLLFGIMPMKINLSHFLLLGSLFFCSTFVIRHFVQRWVMEEEERGFHLAGGLLLIGTWWIHLLGFVFTLFRREVPYKPTPKDGKEENTFGLNIPNIGLGVLSLLAIIYGLSKDFNPYTLVMAGFAGLNILFVTIILWMSYQSRFHFFRKNSPVASSIYAGVRQVKVRLWIFRHRVYGVLRFAALPVLLLVITGLYYYTYTRDITQIEPVGKRTLSHTKFVGVYISEDSSGIADLAKINAWTNNTGIQPGVISTYLAWEPLDQSPFPFDLMDAIFEQNSYPMITWEPWLSEFGIGASLGSTELLKITEGHFDSYLSEMALNFKRLNKPVFLRFAHEPDNPDYPWYSAEPSAPQDYIKAWRYVHRFMTCSGVTNLIWVFNPWKADAANPYFPGVSYVDWLAVTALNYGPAAGAGNWNSFESLYAPFHRTTIFQHGLPVMLAEFGTLGADGAGQAWFVKALDKLNDEFPEVKACVLFAPKYDLNVPKSATTAFLDWSGEMAGFEIFDSFQTDFVAPQNVLLRTPGTTAANTEGIPETGEMGALRLPAIAGQPLDAEPNSIDVSLSSDTDSIPEADFRAVYRQIQGVNYQKGQDWQSSLFPLFRKVILDDFEHMRQLNLGWIKRYGPGVYDRNILDGALEKNLQVMYALWINDNVDYNKDREALEELKIALLKNVAENRNEEAIKAWHIGNPVWHSLADQFNMPKLIYQRRAWLEWVAGLVSEIKKIDSSRPVSIELDDDPYLEEIATEILLYIPQLDAIGINIPSDTVSVDSLGNRLGRLPVTTFINKLPPLSTDGYQHLNIGWFSASWQDDVFENYVSFNGLLDHKGRRKPGYRELEMRKGLNPPAELPAISILRPALATQPGSRLPYQALLSEDGSWRLAAFGDVHLAFNWQLVKTDEFGNALALRDEGQGVTLNLTVPPDPHLYRLRLIVSSEGYSTSTDIPLGTPVYTGSDLRELSREEIEFLYRESRRDHQQKDK